MELSYFEKPWRTLVRIEDITDDVVNVVVPSWDYNQLISLKRVDVPEDIFPDLKPGKRLHARVNIGCDSIEDLVFSDWEAN